jgi:hypothetical protein
VTAKATPAFYGTQRQILAGEIGTVGSTLEYVGHWPCHGMTTQTEPQSREIGRRGDWERDEKMKAESGKTDRETGQRRRRRDG